MACTFCTQADGGVLFCTRLMQEYVFCTQADGGVLEMNTCSPEPETCVFHEDDSGRIIHVSTSQVRY